ncbi:uncharacterized protein LOC110919548 [Helianthus annuus]|uniref:uncharacterized protein LOC110919548 n=1 Tax=Helianthus annuus TaxID=4232 RepID=UPI001652DE96|nr:uncharacterized protein LOC110919548 [Helianthus annuus]
MASKDVKWVNAMQTELDALWTLVLCMEDDMDDMENNSFTPTWENGAESPILLEHVVGQGSTKYKIKLKYGGYFRLAKNSYKKRYCFGFQKCFNIDTCIYDFDDLNEEVATHYPPDPELSFSVFYIDKYATKQKFVKVDSHENFKFMLSMYEVEKELTIYVTMNNNVETSSVQERESDDAHDEEDEEDESVTFSTDDEVGHASSEPITVSSKNGTIKVNSTFENVVEFRRALSHYAIMNEFAYFTEKSEPTWVTARCSDLQCKWRIHASVMQDGISFEVKKLVEPHSCTRSNKGANKVATQGWVASVLRHKLKCDGDVSIKELHKWVKINFNVDLPYMKIFRGKEQTYSDLYGNWEDSFIKTNAFKEELLRRNPGSVVEVDIETKGNKKLFLRFFVSLLACWKGFLVGCRPYIYLDACHLKGKFNGVLVAANSVDGNNSIFPVAYGVLESENKNSWIWFLELLKKAIGTPNGLVISSDMQKGLDIAITQVYPNVEHRECIRHLFSNFQKRFRGDLFTRNLWRAAKTYCVNEHDRLLNEIAGANKDALTYLNENHNKIWSRCRFGETSKCNYVTNNISESFNAWIGEVRYKPVLELLDSIREKIMVRFDKKMRLSKKWKGTLVPKTKTYLDKISKKLGAYEICRSGENRAEVKYEDKRWEVSLDERKCTCRVWQVKGVPCMHATAFIIFIRDVNWDMYVDPFYTIEKFKLAYALEVAPMPTKDQWVHIDNEEKIYPPAIKRPPGRPRKNRIRPGDEPKKRQKCP